MKNKISFNDNLDKNFVGDILKLFQWTNKRWIITFSKGGGPSKKQVEKQNKDELLRKANSSEDSKNNGCFPDAKLME